MRIYDIKNVSALKSALRHFGPFDSYCVHDNGDIEVFKREQCDWCATALKGANPIVIPRAPKWIEKYLAESPLYMEQPTSLDEVGCDDEGNCVCNTCIDYNSPKMQEAMR